jgi:hypothetical protein
MFTISNNARWRYVRNMALLILCISLSACEGKTTVPKLRYELTLQAAEIGELRTVLEGFAIFEGFTIEEASQELSSLPLGRTYFWLTLKRDRTMEIMVHDFEVPNVFTVAFYDMGSDPRFDQTAAKLAAMLHGKWPNALVQLRYD